MKIPLLNGSPGPTATPPPLWTRWRRVCRRGPGDRAVQVGSGLSGGIACGKGPG